jgi:hypothetical protein
MAVTLMDNCGAVNKIAFDFRDFFNRWRFHG